MNVTQIVNEIFPYYSQEKEGFAALFPDCECKQTDNINSLALLDQCFYFARILMILCFSYIISLSRKTFYRISYSL